MVDPQSPITTVLKGNSNFLQWLPGSKGLQQAEDEGGLNVSQLVATLRRRLPIVLGVTTVVASAAMLRALTSTPVYQSQFEILTKPVTVEAQVISSVPQTLSSREEQSSQQGVDLTTLKLLISPKILLPIADKLKNKYPGMNYAALVSNLTVKPIPNSQILAVGFRDEDPGKVKAVLDLVAEAYLDYSLKERLADVQQGIEFVETQLPQLQKRVSNLQDQLQRFRQQYTWIDPDLSNQQLSAQSTAIRQQRLEAQVQLNEAIATYQALTRELAGQRDDSVASSATRESARYQSLLNQLLDVEIQIAKESSLFRENSSNIQVLRDQRENLLPLLQREAERVQKDLASRIQDLQARNQILAESDAFVNQQIKQVAAISRQYTDIQRELKIATDNLNQFLTKREALRIDAGQRTAPWQILTPPFRPTPSAASVQRSAVLGILLGLLLGVGIALLLEKFSSILRTSEDVKDISQLPVLGVIPFNSELEAQEELLTSTDLLSASNVLELAKQIGPKDFSNGETNGSDSESKRRYYTASPFQEAFRSLFANIRLLSSDTQVRSLVISSSISGEGKSTVALYLAQVSAALGQRVLLVDLDLRLPQQHRRSNLLNTRGLSNTIALELDINGAIQQSPLESNLFILTSGPVPPDPGKILSSKKLQALMQQFHETYDLVIYDTPPLIGLADTKLVVSNTDGLIMVVGLNKTKSAILKQALAEVRMSSVNLLGMIANGASDYSTNAYSYNRYFNGNASSQPIAEKPIEEEPALVEQAPD